MVKIFSGIFLILLNLAGAGCVPYPDFRWSNLLNGIDFRLEKYEEIYASFDQKYIQMFEEIYKRNIEAARSELPNGTVRIPKIIHQIWLGGPVPEEYRKWMATWTSLQGWEYKLWTDENVKDMRLYNRDLFDKVDNFGEKSDILRLEVLRNYGGVYVDMDLECLRPDFFEEFHRSFDFYIGIEPLFHGAIYKYHMFKFCNAIIAAAPNHPLVDDLVQNLKANYLAYLHTGVISRTGPSYLTRIICEYELRGAHKQRNMYFPCTIFYPFSICERDVYLSEPGKIFDLFPETAGIHYWNQSWVNSECFYNKKD